MNSALPGEECVVARTGLEPAIFAVKGRCPKPLDDRAEGVLSVEELTFKRQGAKAVSA